MDLNGWLAGRTLVACVGSGGVGKTTTAAAVGLWAAMEGRRVMVLTIDPAKRLANSLGLDQMGGEPTRIDLSSMPDAKGELWAMMLDSRGTFDALIAAIAPTPEARDRVLNNHVYRHMADALAGSQDYMATEKLYDLSSSGDYDLLVLDTPPVKNALDFLEAPGRVVSFLDERVLGWFLAPYKKGGGWTSRIFGGASAVIFRLLGVLFGEEFLDDFARFLQDFNGLYEGFRKRHAGVLEMLRDPRTSFVTVCAPTDSSVDVAVFFEKELAKRGLPAAGVIVNQVHRIAHEPDEGREALAAHAERLSADQPSATAASLQQRLVAAHQQLADKVRHERRLAEQVRAAAPGGFYQEVPRLRGEVHDLEALYRVGRHLFAVPAETLAPKA